MPALLECRHLGVSYGPTPALYAADVVVPDGSLVGVLGPNGAGKSTLLRAVAGLVKPSSGAIFHRGERIDTMRPSQIARRGVTLVPEGRGILPALSVADNLKVSLGDGGGDVRRVLERFPVLESRLRQSAATLSGGEQQMLSLARALGVEADLLLVDEPSLGLAPRLVSMVEETLSHLHDELGRTVVWVEQYASRVLRLADIVYIVGRGRVVWAGEPAELRASPVLVRSYLGGGAI